MLDDMEGLWGGRGRSARTWRPPVGWTPSSRRVHRRTRRWVFSAAGGGRRRWGM